MAEDERRSALLRKIQIFRKLDHRECTALLRFERENQEFGPHTRIINQGDRYHKISVIKSGWVLRSKILEDGRRQVINYALPGDFLCLNAFLFHTSDHTLTTLDNVVLAPFDIGEIGKLFTDFPKLAAAITWCTALEEAMLAERLVTVGRRSSVERVAHVLLELWHRLELLGLAENTTFEMPITQEIMADTLGLSTVHVSRTLAKLHKDGLIRTSRRGVRSVTVTDAQRLERVAGFESGYLHFTERY